MEMHRGARSMRAIFHASTSAVTLKLRQPHLHNRVFANSVLVAPPSIRGKIMWRRTITFFGFVPESQLGKLLATAYQTSVFGVVVECLSHITWVLGSIPHISLHTCMCKSSHDSKGVERCWFCSLRFVPFPEWLEYLHRMIASQALLTISPAGIWLRLFSCAWQASQ
jgi:hypothetical protein